MDQIDKLGGAVMAIEHQFYQQEIAKSAYAYQKSIEEKRKIIVGVNEFMSEEPAAPQLFRVSEEVRLDQIQRLVKIRSERNDVGVRRALSGLVYAAARTDNVVPHILQCVEAYATLGEISDALRSVWGENV